VITSFLLATAMFLLPVGSLSDLTGIRRIFKIGITIFTSIVGCLWICSFRFLAYFVPVYTGDWCSVFQHHRTGYSCICLFCRSTGAEYWECRFRRFTLACHLVRLPADFLTQYFGWRSIFFVSSAMGILTIITAFLFLGNDNRDTMFQRKKAETERFPVYYMAGLVAMVYGSSRIPEIPGWFLMIGGLLALILFWRIESQSAMSVLEIKLFTRNRLFAFSNLAALINYSATFAIIFLLSLYLQKVQELSPRDAGIVLVAQPAMMAIFSPFCRTTFRWHPAAVPGLAGNDDVYPGTGGFCFPDRQQRLFGWL
jgi:MFS family permease